MATDSDFWDRFRRWRRTRPFWGGLFLVLASILFFLSANLHPFGNIQINLGPAGFLSYVIPVVILMCGLLGWFTPAQRIFYGVIALVTCLYSLVSLNFGGWGLSMFVGFAGGALLIAWGPPRIKPGAATPPPPTGHSGDDAVPEPSSPEAVTERIETAGHDDRPTEDVRPAFIPGMEPEEPPRGVFRGKALVVGLAAAGLAASFLVAGGSRPARAEVECPEGLPSRSTSPSAPASSASASSASPSAPAPSDSATPSASLVLPVAGRSSAAGPGPSGAAPESSGAAASPSQAPPAAADEDGHPVVDGVKGVADGVGDLLGIKGDESASPEPSVSPTPPTEPTASRDTSGPGSTAPDPTGSTAQPTKTADPSGEPSKTAGPAASASTQVTAPSSAPEPDPSGSELPCLGPRIFGKVSDGGGIGLNAIKPGLMQDTKLTLIDATYEGVADVPTRDGGTMKALQFNMSKAINDNFRLTIDEVGGGRTLFKANQLITDQNVRFYTPRFEGKFGGLIPMTFTPEQPPPLMLPKMVFTDVSIDLAHVYCDTLTSTPLSITATG
ncbi:hypothetical protein HH310_10190 [Actinoplanes sp. TBRC 11911]|uniref:DUF6114 domain-containing protein n=1 Tax=Actinoplanes sp. TBRC 11911 TaxID=2729386 RepID=UPI00145CECF5|nr:DUF6114 domain-containing protein [Actinoplanes sp. TBRC 11911]NMO51559.1 hypothetical protein [Actinoplanes sp. TBRC 11911]